MLCTKIDEKGCPPTRSSLPKRRHILNHSRHPTPPQTPPAQINFLGRRELVWVVVGIKSCVGRCVPERGSGEEREERPGDGGISFLFREGRKDILSSLSCKLVFPGIVSWRAILGSSLKIEKRLSCSLDFKAVAVKILSFSWNYDRVRFMDTSSDISC
jgi:hypothetical protein